MCAAHNDCIVAGVSDHLRRWRLRKWARHFTRKSQGDSPFITAFMSRVFVSVFCRPLILISVPSMWTVSVTWFLYLPCFTHASSQTFTVLFFPSFHSNRRDWGLLSNSTTMLLSAPSGRKLKICFHYESLIIKCVHLMSSPNLILYDAQPPTKSRAPQAYIKRRDGFDIRDRWEGWDRRIPLALVRLMINQSVFQALFFLCNQ